MEPCLTAAVMPAIHLDTNALIALADPAEGIVAIVRDRAMAGSLPAAWEIARAQFSTRTSKPATLRKWASSAGPTNTPNPMARAVAATAMSF